VPAAGDRKKATASARGNRDVGATWWVTPISS